MIQNALQILKALASQIYGIDLCEYRFPPDSNDLVGGKIRLIFHPKCMDAPISPSKDERVVVNAPQQFEPPTQ